MWCPNDKRGCVADTLGQIGPHTNMGQLFIQFVKDVPLRNIVDIGTWNGLGSTRCFLMGLKENTSATKPEIISLETNRDKNELAKHNLSELLTDVSGISLLWGSILKAEELDNILTVFPEVAEGEYKRWHAIDMENIVAAPYLMDKMPEEIDFVLFDGGEFTTYYEFQKLFSRCVKFIALDDVHTPKCMKIRNILQAHPDWKELIYNNERHGFSLFLKSP